MDTEIYAIQCFQGETITFGKLRSGTPAAIEEPIVLHQKIRYLDEELSRMISIYDIREEDAKLFENTYRAATMQQNSLLPEKRASALSD